jgi:hypothetical protein
MCECAYGLIYVKNNVKENHAVVLRDFWGYAYRGHSHVDSFGQHAFANPTNERN